MAIETRPGGGPARPRGASRPTSRSSTRRSTGTGWSTSTRRRRRRSRPPSSRRWTPTTASDNANVHRGIYALSERATAAYEGARAKVARLINAPDPQDDHLDPQRDRVDQPRRVQLGPQAHRARRRDRAHRDGAPREPRPVADPGPGEGRGPRVHPDHRRRDPAPGRVRRAAPAQAQAGRVHPRVATRWARSTRSRR